MKKLFFFTLIMLVAVSVSSNAQTKFGLKAGINIANVTGDLEGSDSRMAPYFGVFANFALSEKVVFQPELLYSMKGDKDSYTENYEGVNVNVEKVAKFDYLDIPLMFKFKPGGGFNLLAGPQIGLLLSAKIKTEASAQGISASEEEDIKEYMKGVDFGLGFGLGYEFDFGLGIDARYNLGLSNVSDESGVEVKNNAIQIGVSYNF